jgi:solute carrier family 39 (zinc transporter), member 1/2/3
MAENVTPPASVMDPMGGKPVCGSGQEVGEYDLGLHVAALCKSRCSSTPMMEDINRLLLVMVLAASIFGAGFPVVAKKVKWVKVPAKTFFICKHFGTGVLIATAFVHV